MLINIYQRGETKTMKKSSAWFMLTPGLVILFLFLAIPLLRVLFPSIFSGAYPFDAYVGFFQDEYYRKIFIQYCKDRSDHYLCLHGGRYPNRLFYQPVQQEMERDPSCSFHFPNDDQLCNTKLCMDQYPGKQRHYQQSAGWTGSGAKAIKTAVYRLFHYHWFCVSVSSSDDRNSSRCYGKY